MIKLHSNKLSCHLEIIYPRLVTVSLEHTSPDFCLIYLCATQCGELQNVVKKKNIVNNISRREKFYNKMREHKKKTCELINP